MEFTNYESYRENTTHGNAMLPFVTYGASIPALFRFYPIHWHDEMEIIHIRKGQGIISMNLVPHMVKEGDIVLITPGMLHSMEQYETDSMSYDNILFSMNMLLTSGADACTLEYILPLLKNEIFLPASVHPGQDIYDKLYHYVTCLKDIYKHKNNGYELALKGQLFLMFWHLFSNGAAKKSDKMMMSAASIDKLKQVIKYIEIHYNEKITIEKAAQICGFSPSHFMKFFKTSLGTTFTKYVNDYRLTIASDQLLSTGRSVLEIAENAGFDNLSYFNRIFKNKYRMTPKEFRRSQ